MANGFIYTVTTLTKAYVQKAFCAVPTQFGDRIYFGPCKVPMRPRIKHDDYVFGISPSKVGPRRIVFVSRVEERLTFAEAYERFPNLHGPNGPIHVRPIRGSSDLPHCSYEHIPGAIHADRWKKDLASQALDAFFVCWPQNGCVGRWLGEFGPQVDEEILDFLKTCSVHGQAGELRRTNDDATLQNPIAYKRLSTGLHLETNQPDVLLRLCKTRMACSVDHLDDVPIPNCDDALRVSCGSRKPLGACR